MKRDPHEPANDADALMAAFRDCADALEANARAIWDGAASRERAPWDEGMEERVAAAAAAYDPETDRRSVQ